MNQVPVKIMMTMHVIIKMIEASASEKVRG